MPRLINAATSFVQQGKIPAFSVRSRSNGSFTDGGTEKITWNTVQVTDTVGGWSTTNNRYTVKVKGVYLFTYEDLPYMAGATTRYAEYYLYKNGSNLGSNFIHTEYQSTRNYEYVSGSRVEECVPGDYFEIYRFTGNGATSNNNGGFAKFTGRLISA